MHCLACGGRIVPGRLWGAEIDRCMRCRAVWLDSFQLALLLTGSSAGPEATVARAELETGAREAVAVACPACEAGALGVQRFRTAEIVRCAACRGLLVSMADLVGARRDERRRRTKERRAVLGELLRESGFGLAYLSAGVLYLILRPLIDAVAFGAELRVLLLSWLHARVTRPERGAGPPASPVGADPPV